MKNKSLFRYLLYAWPCLLLLLPHLGFAADSSILPADGNVLDIFNPPAVVNGTDKSLLLLGQIFGTVDGALFGTGSHVMGVMFGVYNSAVIFLGGIVLIYTIVVGVLNTAQEGEVMGRKWSSHWITLRVALGFALLIPKASGYCLIQILVMWLVVQGVGAADTLWGNTVHYIKNGGTLVSTGVSKKDAEAIIQQAGKVLQMQTCVYNAQKIYNNLHSEQLPLSLQVGPPRLEGSGYSHYVIYFPDVTTQKDPLKMKGMCGNITWSVQGGDQFAEMQRMANWQMVQDLQSYAQSYIDTGYANNQTADPKTPPSFNLDDDRSAEMAILGAALDYIAISDKAVRESNTANQDALAKDLDSSTNEGWITAGAYYSMLTKHANSVKSDKDLLGTINDFNLSDITDKIENNKCSSHDAPMYKLQQGMFHGKNCQNITHRIIENSRYHFVGIKRDCSVLGSKSKVRQLATKCTSSSVDYGMNYLTGQALKRIQHPDVQGETFTKDGWFIGAAVGVNVIGGMGFATGSVAAGAVTLGLATGLDSVMGAFIGTFSKANMDPILGLSVMGKVLINVAGAWWILLAVAMTGISYGTGLMACASSLYWAQQAFTNWMIPLMTTLCTLFFTSGAVLEFYVPFIPYIIFLFGAMGWFMGVIESMVAAPLVAIGLAHPESHEAFGRAEPALMLLTNIFLRPSLMIIGFISAILLSYVGLKLLNMGMTNAMKMISQGGKFGPFDFLVFPIAMIIIYTMIVLQIVNKSFALINEVPNKVLRWIGGAEQLGDGTVDTSSIQGAISSGASQTGQALGTAQARQADSQWQAGREKREDQWKKKGNDPKPGLETDDGP